MLTSQQPKKKKKSQGAWIDALYEGIGRNCYLETKEGITRSGKITGLRTKDITFNNERVAIVTELELNGDPTDTMTINSLAKLSIG